MNITQTTLKFLNAVVSKPAIDSRHQILENGVVILAGAAWASTEIVAYAKAKKLTPDQLNKTFHKSWKIIKESSRWELFVHQALHYASTYGTDFCGETYFPVENLDIPEEKIRLYVVQALSKEEIKSRLLSMLRSGIAMPQEDAAEIIDALTALGHTFSTDDKVQNKEAVVLLAEKFNLYPENPAEFLRYCVFKSTGKTLLIKSSEAVASIKSAEFNPAYHFRTYGLERLAPIFNRFKLIFLAYKKKCPREVNKISKLSKTLHRPFVQSSLNFATSENLGDVSQATVFALLRAWGAIHNARHERHGRVFNIRNGKSYVTSNLGSYDADVLDVNEQIIIQEIKRRVVLPETVHIPENVDYALPVSLKMFVGNVPTGTRFYGNNLAAGVYWENAWGARDIDLSGITAEGKVGWNARYNQGRNALLYSGDMTDAANGATEFLYSDGDKFLPTILTVNIFRGTDSTEYAVVVGKPPKKEKEYMMNPNKTICHIKTKAVQNQMVLGLFHQVDDRQAFTIVNVGAGSARVSGGKHMDTARDVFINRWSNCLTLRKALVELGVDLVDDRTVAALDLSQDVTTKESFIKLFSEC
jgi:hypothetical protein